MNLEYPYFQVNFKVYPGTYGEAGLQFAKMIDRVRDETGAELTLTPQLPDIRLIARETDLTLTAPFVDAIEPGRGMGRILPEAVREAGAEGVVVNHAENRDTLTDVARKLDRCRAVGLDSIVCVDSVEMGRAVLAFDPDSVVFEKPEDISTDRAITQTHPERVREFVSMRDDVNPRTKVLVGGGIKTADDVRKAFEQGADATGAASAISLADDPEARLREIAAVLP
jgi:triosephosphate isomerase